MQCSQKAIEKWLEGEEIAADPGVSFIAAHRAGAGAQGLRPRNL